MSDAKGALAKASQGLVNRLDPEVVTEAKPEADALLRARAALGSDSGLQRLVLEYKLGGKSNEWLADALGVRLNARWGGDQADDAYQAALYLVDEYDQLGEGVHLVSTETGKVTITLTEEDIYQPAPLPREHGGMAVPLPRIRPDLEAALTTWTFERSREERLVQALAARGHQTAFLIQEGDPRLQIATRTGRKAIVESLTEFSPKTLLSKLGGTSAAFLNHFDVRSTSDIEEQGLPEQLADPLRGHVEAQSVMNISDPTTSNLHYSRAQTLRGALPQMWVRQVAWHISHEAHKEDEHIETAVEKPVGPAIHEKALRLEHFGTKAVFWCAPPELMLTMRRILPKGSLIMPVDRGKVIGFLKAKVGTLVVPDQFAATSHELFERWEAVANLDYEVYVDWKGIKVVPVTGVTYQGHIEE